MWRERACCLGGLQGPLHSAAIVSRAVHGDSWTVRLYPESAPLTAYAYCAPKGKLFTSGHEARVTATKEGANNTASARCASGEKVVSGGYVMSPVSATEHNSPTYRDYAAGAGKWTVMSVFETPPAKLEALAYCARGVVVKVRSVSSAPIHDDDSGSATASCHKGETLLSGGYTTTPTPDWNNKAGPDFFYNSSYRSGARSWTASGINYSKAAGKITAFANCTP